MVGADVVVKYADIQGVERWVTRRTRDHASMPGDGRVQVLFDPLQPDRDDLVFVSFHRDPHPTEWVGGTV
ncbi:hypothetical protein [Nocardioides sp. LHG3406-4]|uniref:hypothetical protein n=1 Tax=Nocardioides sp. LHG3406-4 TaxID=2804575 RepID=UPI003CEF2DAF